MYDQLFKQLNQSVSGIFRLKSIRGILQTYVIGKDNAILAILDDNGICSYFLDQHGSSAQENAFIGFYKSETKSQRLFTFADVVKGSLERNGTYQYQVRLRLGGVEIDQSSSEQRVTFVAYESNAHKSNAHDLSNQLQAVTETICLGLCSPSSIRFGKLAQETSENAQKVLRRTAHPSSQFKPLNYPRFTMHGVKVSYTDALDQLCADALVEVDWLRARLNADRSYASGLNPLVPAERGAINADNASADYILEEYETAEKYLSATTRHLTDYRAGYKMLTD